VQGGSGMGGGGKDTVRRRRGDHSDIPFKEGAKDGKLKNEKERGDQAGEKRDHLSYTR